MINCKANVGIALVYLLDPKCVNVPGWVLIEFGWIVKTLNRLVCMFMFLPYASSYKIEI